MMNKRSAWEKFRKSGKVHDYLTYKSSDMTINNTGASLTGPEANTHLGEHHENICKWNNYPRNGLR